MSNKRIQIIDAATKAAKQNGLKSLSFRQLADEVGVKSSSVHYHFPTKLDLAESMVRNHTQYFETLLSDIAQREQTLQGKLNALIQIFEEVRKSNDMCLCGMMAAEINTLNPNTRTALKEFFDMTEHWLIHVIEQHRDDIQTPISLQALGHVMLSGLEGAILLDRIDETNKRLEAFKHLIQAIMN